MRSAWERIDAAQKAMGEACRFLRDGEAYSAYYTLYDELMSMSGDEADDIVLKREYLSGRTRGVIRPEVREFVCARDMWECGICNEEVNENDLHIDHVVPVFLGGDEGVDNLRVTHRKCNLSRKYEEFSFLEGT